MKNSVTVPYLRRPVSKEDEKKVNIILYDISIPGSSSKKMMVDIIRNLIDRYGTGYDTLKTLSIIKEGLNEDLDLLSEVE